MYNITDLIEFNHALIYGFEPESSPRCLAGSEILLDTLVPAAGQHEDMLAAYLFAQNSILPAIRERGFANISEEQFIEWIKTLHSFIGKTLLETQSGVSGNYADQMVLLWHYGSDILMELAIYFSGQHACKSAQAFALHLEKNYDLSKKDGLAFIRLVRKLAANPSIEPHHTELKTIANTPTQLVPGILALNKLTTAHNTELLSPQEKIISDKVVKVCMFPEQVPAAMQEFARTTKERFSTCDRNDLNQVVRFLADTFYHFTDIHPFPNANGRTGTCLMNIFLRVFNLPSILLHHPGEKKDKSSLYSVAMAQIDQSRFPLQDLIKIRIEKAQQETFSNTALEKIIALRVGLSQLITRMHQNHPCFNIELVRDGVDYTALSLIRDAEQQTIYLLTAMIANAARIEQQLDASLRARPTLISLQPDFDADAKQLLIANLGRLSGKDGWRVSVQKGLVAWIEIPDMAEAKKVRSALQEAGVMDVVLSQRQDNKIPVIKCDNINYKRLNDLFAAASSSTEFGRAM